MNEHGSPYVRAAVIVTALAAIMAVAIQGAGLIRLNRVVSGVEWNRERLAVIEDTLARRTARFAAISDGIRIAGDQVDTLTARVERLERVERSDRGQR